MNLGPTPSGFLCVQNWSSCPLAPGLVRCYCHKPHMQHVTERWLSYLCGHPQSIQYKIVNEKPDQSQLLTRGQKVQSWREREILNLSSISKRKREILKCVSQHHENQEEKKKWKFKSPARKIWVTSSRDFLLSLIDPIGHPEKMGRVLDRLSGLLRHLSSG